MLMSPVEFRSEKGCAGDAGQKLKSTDTTSRQRGQTHINTHETVKKIIKEIGKNLVAGPSWMPDTKTDWPTDCRS
jgi:hypothetical protein